MKVWLFFISKLQIFRLKENRPLFTLVPLPALTLPRCQWVGWFIDLRLIIEDTIKSTIQIATEIPEKSIKL